MPSPAQNTRAADRRRPPRTPPTGAPAATPAVAALGDERQHPGCHGSVRGRAGRHIRSAAMVCMERGRWFRSTEIPTCARIRSASRAAAGTSIITPAHQSTRPGPFGEAPGLLRQRNHGTPSPRARRRSSQPQSGLRRVVCREAPDCQPQSGCPERREPDWLHRDGRRISAVCPSPRPVCG